MENKTEKMRSEEQIKTDNLLSVCGTWEDERNPEQQIIEIQSSRRSKNNSIEFNNQDI